MDFQDMRIELHKDKNIGKVLFIVEGSRTEPYIMTKLFTSILDYQLETKLREKGYKQYNSKVNPDSKIFVINAQQSNIRFIEKDDGYLNNLFKELIEEYDFDIDNAAIFYIYDRDDRSNTDNTFLENLLSKLGKRSYQNSNNDCKQYQSDIKRVLFSVIGKWHSFIVFRLTVLFRSNHFMFRIRHCHLKIFNGST